MKKLIFTLLMVILISYGFSVLSDYSFTQSTGTYTELSASTQIHGTDVDDAMSPTAFDIGFTFVYDDLPYTQFKCNSNGFITLNLTSTASLSNVLATQTLILGALWDDLKTDATDASVSYQLTGVAPNRALVVQYKNLKWYYNATPVNLTNFQIVLNETSNTIQFIYGTIGAAPSASATASIGITGAVAGNYISITPADPTATYSTTTAFAAINATHVPFFTGKMYTFSPPVAVPNDLQAMSLTGSTTPSSGTSTAYTINVRNRGTSAQSNYSVKLMSGNTEIASIAGPALAAGQISPVVVNWTPIATGPMVLTGKVVLTGDQNSTNDVTSPLNINVQPQGTNLVIIGDVNSALNQRQPFGVYWGYERDASLYTQEQIGLFGSLSSIQWYCHTAAAAVVPYQIYIKSTTETALTAVPWATMVADAQLVGSGTQTFSETGWVSFPLTVPYVYSGGNVIIMVETTYTGTGVTPYPYFRYSTGATGSHQYWYADTTPPTGSGYLNALLPNIGLSLSATVQVPQFAVTPQTHNYGQVYINTNNNKTFTIVNTGGGPNPLIINSISITGNSAFTLQNLPTLPISLPSFQSTTFVARYNSASAGSHTATINIVDNLTSRTSHPVALTGTSIDPTIYTPPYVQNFDAVTIPNLPIDWTKLTQTTAGTITTSTTGPHSPLNSVYMYNSSDATANLLLLAPPVANNLPLVTMRVKFWAKGGVGYTLGVGVTADPTDAATYSEVASQTLTAEWAEYVIGFQTYAGQGHYITFKHGLGATYRSIYIDDVTIEVTPQNDLAALSLAGNITPTAGTPTNYTVNLFNWGTNPQSNYTVKLYNGDNLELASVAGPQIEAGMTAQAILSWTPANPGPAIIYGKVVLTGDQNNLNDQSANVNVNVQPVGTFMVTIGDGVTNQRQPFGIFFGYERDASLYTQEQIGMFGVMSGIQWYCATASTNAVPYKIYLKTTSEAALTAVLWADMITDATLVAESTYTFSQTGWNFLPLTTPWVYPGGNLIVIVETFYGGTGTSPYPYFNYTTGATGSHQVWYADTTPPSGNGTLNTYLPNVGLALSAADPNPHFNVSPQSYTYSQIFINTHFDKVFNVINTGGGTTPLVINSIALTGSPMFSLQNLPTLPISLASFSSTTFGVRYSPTAAGTHTATITITDNLGRSYDYSLARSSRNEANRTQHTVEISGSCMDPIIYTPPYVQNFDSVTTPNLPIDWSKVVTSPATLTTSTTSPHSIPNCVYLYNSSSTAGPYLISPPIANNLPLVTMRVKFWAKGGTTYNLGVGVIADPADTGTYEQVSSLTLTATWAEYVVGFQTYAGNGHYIAFKHGNAATYQGIYIDDVTIEVTPQNDLAALSITGNSTPTVNVQSTYNVNVFNWGTNAQSNYTVKIYNGDNLELASVAGPQVDPGLSVQVPINWTPTTAGDFPIYGKAVLTGDQNNLNDLTSAFNVSVQPEGTMVVTIGDGTSTQRQPMAILYGYERDASLYTAENVGILGNINAVRWYCGTTAVGVVPYKIYLKNTTDNALIATPWATMITDATLMKEGTYTFSQTGWVSFSFDVPFLYIGGNIIVMVETFYGGTGTTSPAFRYTTSPTGSHQYWYADTTAPSGSGYLNTSRPNLGISMTAVGTEPQFAITPATHNFNQVFINTTTNKTFNIINVGGGTNPLVINSITITGSTMFTLQNLPTFPVSLTSFQTSSFVARYTPTAIGTHTATITVTDNLGRSFDYKVSRNGRDNGLTRTAHPVQIDGTCIDPTIYTPPYSQSFDTVTSPTLPIDWSKLMTSTAAANVTTVTTTPHSLPNCVLLTNSSDTNANVILVSPPIATALPINTMRVKFWAKAVAGYTLNVGILNSPTDIGTFIQSSPVTLTATWTEYVVAFQTYTGSGHYIGFQHGLGGASRSIYIDDITIEVTPQNDLAALLITGNPTPSVGMLTNYTVNLFNWGTNPQTTYTVKLYNSDNLELASVAGPTIAAGFSAQIQLPWTPTVAGPVTIFGKVILTGDQNNLNDQTPNLTVGVQPPGVVVQTIGTGTSTQRQPFGALWGYERDASLITVADMGTVVMGTFTGFQWNCTTSAVTSIPYKVYIKATTDSVLTATPWATMTTGATLIQEGTIAFGQTGWVPITFTTPYLYLGGNFIIMVETFYGGTGTGTYPSFSYTTSPAGRHQYWYADTTAPTGNGTLNTSRPNIGIFVIPGGVGHLTGNVYGAGNILLDNATVQILNGGSATTNALGHYMIQNIIAETYQVTASRFGYNPLTLTVVIPEDSTVTQNFTLTQMPTVTVTGTIVGSDAPGVGIAGATINLNGMEDYTATTNAAGLFSITGVYANQTYDYQASAVGYQMFEGSTTVGATEHNMGTITVSEIAYTPRNITATQNENHTAVTVTWLAPDPNAVDITQNFESATFPPTDWARTITNTGVGANGVAFTWCRFGTVVDGTTTVTPPEGSWQCGFWWHYQHQDEWLITPQFNCPQSAHLDFGTYVFRGSANLDHYYVKISNNNGADWTVLWDASTQTGGWNNYQTPIVIDLSAYAGQQVKIAWHADDHNDEGMWYNWFIDNVVISNTVVTLRFSEDQLTTKSASVKDSQLSVINSDVHTSRATDRNSLTYDRISPVTKVNSNSRTHGRSLLGYQVWRLLQGQEQNETAWVPLTTGPFTTSPLTDSGWAALAPGTYKWAVKAVYTGSVLSLAAYSNTVQKIQEPQGVLTGFVRNQNNLPISGAVITAGSFTTTTNASGSYTLTINTGTYSVTCTATGYQAQTLTNITINANQTTTQNFTMQPTVANQDIVEVTATALKGNFPNPFNPATMINYDVKVAAPVRIDIYNLKGQLIRTLVNEVKANGHHQILWDGKDNNGCLVASGVYHYRMRAGAYKADRMMMLMK